jgi:4-cresol dehydrogenase (hydroxylating) flavoprotein subunit
MLTMEIADILRTVVGANYLCTNTEELDRYSRCTIPWQRQCSAVIFPANVDEVIQIVAIAARYKLPLWTFSGGRNWGYGATLATEDAALVMILERMNRIIEVNEELAYTVIEPGVTYEQLNAYLKQNNHKLWVDCIDGTPKGSVIGNALERGIGETPYGDHFGNLCGLEVVLPSGELIRTGGALSGLKTWNVHKWGIGPYLEGLFSQSNFGIVTKAGLWLMPEPEVYNSYVFEIMNAENVPHVLDTFRRLALQGVVTTKLHMINDYVSLTVLTQRAQESVSQQGQMAEKDIQTLRRKFRVAPWSCAGGIYGTREQVKIQRTLLRKALRQYGKLIFLSDNRLAVVKPLIRWAKRSSSNAFIVEKLFGTSIPLLEIAPYVHNVLRGIPTEQFLRHAYFRNRKNMPDHDINPAHDCCGLIWFAPVLPCTSREVMPYLDQCAEKFRRCGFDFYVALLLMNPRAVICVMSIIYDKEDPKEIKQAEQLYDELMRDMQEMQFQQYRGGLASWRDMYAISPELLNLNNRIKMSLDPDNILAPGRYGIGMNVLRDPA